jgi:excisionase family DNA binding protein
MNADQAAEVLGVSRRQVYALAAPGGPIPCTRIGKRIIFDESDLVAFKESCRCMPAPKLPRLSISSGPIRVSNPGGPSPLQKLFEEMGIRPKLTHDAGKNPRRK